MITKLGEERVGQFAGSLFVYLSTFCSFQFFLCKILSNCDPILWGRERVGHFAGSLNVYIATFCSFSFALVKFYLILWSPHLGKRKLVIASTCSSLFVYISTCCSFKFF